MATLLRKRKRVVAGSQWGRMTSLEENPDLKNARHCEIFPPPETLFRVREPSPLKVEDVDRIAAEERVFVDGFKQRERVGYLDSPDTELPEERYGKFTRPLDILEDYGYRINMKEFERFIEQIPLNEHLDSLLLVLAYAAYCAQDMKPFLEIYMRHHDRRRIANSDIFRSHALLVQFTAEMASKKK